MQSSELSDGHADSEFEVGYLGVSLGRIVALLVKTIFRAVDNSTPSVKCTTPRLLHLQRGDCDMTTKSDTPYLSSTVSMVWKQTEVSFTHLGNDGLQNVMPLNSLQETHGAAAIAIKVSKPDRRPSAELIESFFLSSCRCRW